MIFILIHSTTTNAIMKAINESSPKWEIIDEGVPILLDLEEQNSELQQRQRFLLILLAVVATTGTIL